MMKPKVTFLTTLIALLVSGVMTGYLHASQQCVIDAWASFNLGTRQGYENAIKAADKCIDDFGKKASIQQAELKQPPPVGRVTEPEKNKIFDNWALNDVATACYIKGRSAEYLYKQAENDAEKNKYKNAAKQAYEKSCNYEYGRTWDPSDSGFFWSPCVAAKERLPLLGL